MIKPEDLIASSENSTLRFMKQEFNKIAARINKADEYYSNPNTTEAEIERTFDTLLLLMRDLSIMGNEIEKLFNIEITTDIVINGFKDI